MITKPGSITIVITIAFIAAGITPLLSQSHSVPLVSTMLSAGQNEAASNLVSIKNGTVGGTGLPAGQNEADSNLISLQNGTVGSTGLPTGQNEADSNLISLQNGTIGSTGLPTGQNEADSNLISLQNGTIGSTGLPAGQNEAVSNLISASNGASTNAVLSRINNLSMASGSGSDGARSTRQSLAGAEFNAGETVSLSADVPAQIWLNRQRAGNDPDSSVDLTFVVPEQSNSLSMRPGDSADSTALVQKTTTLFTGKVLGVNGMGIANAQVHLRHAGLTAEFFQLNANALAEDHPSMAGLKPLSEEPVSSLNLHNPNAAFGYFPVGAIQAPNFAVSFGGQFLAQTSGTYRFYLAATEGAQLTIDGHDLAPVRVTTPGLEAPAPVALAAGWHSISLLVYSKTTYAELVLAFAPPGGSRQLLDPKLLRSESSVLSAVTSQDGAFTITAPAWLDQVEAMASVLTDGGKQAGLSAIAKKGESNLGKVYLSPR